MAIYERILVTTDFSGPSRRGIEAAVSLAVRFDAELIVLHVSESSPARVGWLLSEGHVKDAHQLATQAAKAELRALEEGPLAAAPRVKTLLVETRTPVEGICEAAEKHAVDLIVMATHGRTGLPRLLIGSVTERVVRRAPCPVMVVRARPDEG